MSAEVDDNRRSLEPRVARVGHALAELAEFVGHRRLTAAAALILAEAEDDQPNELELCWMWERAREILTGVHASGRAGCLAEILLAELKRPPV